VKKSVPDVQEVHENFPGFGQLLGKLFNSVFLDRLLWDLDRLSRINTVLECVDEITGKDGIKKLQAELVKRGRRPYETIGFVGIRPSADIGEIAGELLRSPHLLNTQLGYFMKRILGSTSAGVSDAASYLLFDGAFADRLMDLGSQDAAECASDIDRLLS
jgi:NTE family protein